MIRIHDLKFLFNLWCIYTILWIFFHQNFSFYTLNIPWRSNLGEIGFSVYLKVLINNILNVLRNIILSLPPLLLSLLIPFKVFEKLGICYSSLCFPCGLFEFQHIYSWISFEKVFHVLMEKIVFLMFYKEFIFESWNYRRKNRRFFAF